MTTTIHLLVVWALVLAYAGAGLVNAIGGQGTKESFVRWGYPAWWGLVTGGLEIVSAALIALPQSRDAGYLLGGAIILAAIATLLRHRGYAHLPGCILVLALTAVAMTTA
jgi:hypothetical protein